MVEEKKDRTPAENDDEPFLVRWSRRKQAVRQEQEPRAEEPGDTPVSDSSETGAEAAGEQSFTDEDLPPPETLGPDSDFSAYLSGRVSSGLRRAAMRRLFSLPDFNVRDGLDDYDEDYTGFQSLGKIVTARMKYHTERLEERERDRENERRAAADERAESDASSAEDVSGTPSDPGMDGDGPDTDIDTAAHEHDEDPDDRS